MGLGIDVYPQKVSSVVFGNGSKIVPIAGTSVRLSDVSLEVQWVIITAFDTNGGFISYGDSTTFPSGSLRSGSELSPLGVVRLDNVDLYNVYINSTMDGEGVGFSYGA